VLAAPVTASTQAARSDYRPHPLTIRRRSPTSPVLSWFERAGRTRLVIPRKHVCERLQPALDLQRVIGALATLLASRRFG